MPLVHAVRYIDKQKWIAGSFFYISVRIFRRQLLAGWQCVLINIRCNFTILDAREIKRSHSHRNELNRWFSALNFFAVTN